MSKRSQRVDSRSDMETARFIRGGLASADPPNFMIKVFMERD